MKCRKAREVSPSANESLLQPASFPPTSPSNSGQFLRLPLLPGCRAFTFHSNALHMPPPLPPSANMRVLSRLFGAYTRSFEKRPYITLLVSYDRSSGVIQGVSQLAVLHQISAESLR